jgi:hypothetical protein
MPYAPEYEKELLDRPLRHRMGMPRTPCPAFQQERTTESPHHPPDPQCDLLHLEKRLSLVVVAPRLPTVGDCLLLIKEVTYQRDMGEVERAAVRARAARPE